MSEWEILNQLLISIDQLIQLLVSVFDFLVLLMIEALRPLEMLIQVLYKKASLVNWLLSGVAKRGSWAIGIFHYKGRDNASRVDIVHEPRFEMCPIIGMVEAKMIPFEPFLNHSESWHLREEWWRWRHKSAVKLICDLDMSWYLVLILHLRVCEDRIFLAFHETGKYWFKL